MNEAEIKKMAASMKRTGYDEKEIAYALDIRMKDLHRILEMGHA